MADNLVLGRGKLFFAPYPKGATTGGVKGYFGNTPTLTLAQTNTKLDHYSSEGGLKIKDKSIVLQTDMTLTFDCDNINDGNLALWFGGNDSDTLPTDAPGDLGSIAVIGKADTIYGAMFFESDNPVGNNKNYWFPYVTLTPNGNYALKGDTWQMMSFTAECLKRDPATQRVYVYSPTSGTSTAAGDTTAEFTVDAVAVDEDLIAATATLTATTPQVHAVPFDVTFTLNSGTGGSNLLAYLFVNSGSVVVATMKEAIGATGTVSMTIPNAGTVQIKAFNNALGTGTAIGTSANVVAT